jgi:Na+/glutamate symporter
VFFDALHTIAFFEAPVLSALFTLIEDGGEMLVVSIMTAYAFDIASNFGQQRIGLWARLRPALNRGLPAAT